MRIASLLLLLLASASASAQQGRIVNYSIGTGFFVNRDGYVVTNNHVVEKCKSIAVEGAVARVNAALINTDAGNDLALLKTNTTPPASGDLRDESDALSPGERVITVGFPGGKGPIMRDAMLLDVKGPTGETKWLQFSDAVQKGNSGGPLMDGAGNIIGVVMAKAVIYTLNQQNGQEETIGNSDIAIRLSTLRGFLDANNVRYRDEMSGVMTSAHSVDDRARQFIVKVMCELG